MNKKLEQIKQLKKNLEAATEHKNSSPETYYAISLQCYPDALKAYQQACCDLVDELIKESELIC